MVHAGGEMGFLPNCLLLFKSGTTSGDYHHDMNGDNYHKWVKTQLIPNLPPNSVVVIDNAPYHNVLMNKAPSSVSKKSDMTNWLAQHNIEFSDTLLKPQLYEIIKRHKQQFIKYKFDVDFENAGHTVLRLPPYHPDLNPIELVWAKIKHDVATRNVTFKFNDVVEITKDEFAKYSVNQWQQCCSHVIKIEETYLTNEHLIDVQTERLIISVNGESSDEDDEIDCEIIDDSD